jgi:TRAP-type C4-dicarboxylate transport system substrate-binding protein
MKKQIRNNAFTYFQHQGWRSKTPKGEIMKKRNIFINVLFVTILAVALTLAGCGGGGGNAGTSDSGSATEEGAATEDAGSTEQLVLKFNSFAPEAIPLGVGMNAAKDKLEELSGGSMTFDLYFDGTLLGFMDTYQGVKEGVVDLALVGPAATDSVTVLNQVFSCVIDYLPADYSNTGVAYNRMLEEVPALNEEFATLGVRMMKWIPLAPSNLHTAGVKVTKPEDMKGVSVEAIGNAVSYWDYIGASAVTLDPADYYVSLERGVVKSQSTHWPCLQGYNTEELVNYHMIFGPAPSAGGISEGACGYIMNLDKWNSLTPEQQAWLDEALGYGAQVNTEIDAADIDGIIQRAQDRGDEIVCLTEEQLVPWREAIAPANAAWVKAATDAGWPAQEVFDTLSEILHEY